MGAGTHRGPGGEGAATVPPVPCGWGARAPGEGLEAPPRTWDGTSRTAWPLAAASVHQSRPMGCRLGRVLRGALCSNSNASFPASKCASKVPTFLNPKPRTIRDAAKMPQLSVARGDHPWHQHQHRCHHHCPHSRAQPGSAQQPGLLRWGTERVELICGL